jgi:TfoX/Sxy family transcriptional regulator of competence genes
MAYDEDLANRIREVLAQRRGVDERPMFGGLAFLIGGHMAVAASGKGGLMVRVAPDDTENLLKRAHVSPMVMAGRETRGWVRVDASGVKTQRQLTSWITRGVDYARSLPPK